MSGRVTDQTLEEIRQRIDIAELIGARLTLKRSGGTYKACCPFHHEKTPSFTVNPVRRSYHCFGCGAHGDVFKFLMQSDGLTFMDAVRSLAQRAGVALNAETDYAAEARNLLLRLHAELAAYYRDCLTSLPAAEPARRYLAQRKLDGETAARFGLGFAPPAPNTLTQWAAQHGYTPEQLVEAGLLAAPNNEQRPDDYYDRFRGRLIFPICDPQGRVVAFSGRILDPKAHPAKYLNSPETALFRKGHILYALDKARAQIVRNPRREAIVCEGQIDVIRCHAGGFETAVASQGTAFTAEHVALLKRYADSVVLVFDGDAAGQKAALRTGALFLQAGMPARVATLPAGEDPDSLLRDRGPEAFQTLLDAAVSLTGFQVRALQAQERDAGAVDAVGRVAREVLDTLAGCSSAVLRSHLLQEAAQLLHLPASALESDLEALLRRQAARAPNAPVAPAAPTVPAVAAAAPAAPDTPAVERPPTASVSRAEFSLCELVMHHHHDAAVMETVRDWLPLEWLKSPAAREVVAAALDGWRCGADRLSELAASGPPAARGLLAQLARADSRMLHASDVEPRHAAEDLVARLWSDALRAEQASLANAPAESPDEKRRQQLATRLRRLSGAIPWERRCAELRDELARRGGSVSGDQ